MNKAHKTNRITLLMVLALLAIPLHSRGQNAPSPEALIRFPVAHEHGGSWCLGYLYIYQDSISYEVTWPSSDKGHSFVLKRSDVKSSTRWSRSGQTLKGAEVKSSKAAYHFWWLVNEQDVINGKPHQNNPPDVGDPDYMIAAILDPATLSKEPAPPSGSVGPADASQLQELPDSPLASSLQTPSGAAGAVSAAAQEVRFAVAHAHNLYGCVGYLYLAPDRVRYEVVQPESDRKHGFNLSRAEITGVQQWVLMGTPRNAAEIKTSHATYHFWLLPEGSDLVNTPFKKWSANDTVPIGSLLAALQGQR